MPPYVPKYVSPKEAAAAKARRRATLYWIAVCVPAVFALLALGYSDQAPAALRSLVIMLDRSLGYPILWIIGTIAGR